MLRDITLGQYFPGNSIIHKADARFKLLSAVIFLVAIFVAKTDAAFIMILAATVIMIIITGIPLKTILKSIKPLLFIICFTAIISLFWTKGDTLLFGWKFIEIYKEGLSLAVFMILRLVCIISSSFVLLTYTTPPNSLTEAIESLLGPLKYIKVPVHEFAMMMTIALRFIPPLIEETDKIMCAQKARGADFESGNLINRAKALIPVLIPLFVSSFRRAEELAQAMECRCYTGGAGRTRMKAMKAKTGDFLMLAVALMLLAGSLYLNGLCLWLSI